MIRQLMNTIACPHCKKEVEISEALRQQFNEQQLEQITAEHEKEIEEAKKAVLVESTKKIEAAFTLQLTQAAKDAEEKEKRNKDLYEKLEQLMDKGLVKAV